MRERNPGRDQKRIYHEGHEEHEEKRERRWTEARSGSIPTPDIDPYMAEL